MKYLIFILASIMTIPAQGEELVEFKPIPPLVIVETKQYPTQSPWQNINEKLSASVFRAHDSRPSSTIVLVHGSGGVADRELHYAYRLQKLGFNIVIIDSFKPRGIINLLNSNRPSLLPPQRAQEDIPAVVNWIKTQNWHSGKIGVLGWSHGGTTILEASPYLDKLGVAGAVVFYPQASRLHNKTSIKVEIHHGTADDWTPFYTSQNLVSPGLFHKPNPLIHLWSYEGAHHGFDHQKWFYRLLGWNEDGYKLRTVAPHNEAELAKKRTEDFFLKILNETN